LDYPAGKNSDGKEAQPMETLYYQDRLLLHKLRRQHPQWRLRELAEGVGRSVSWVKKWLKRCTDRLLQHPKKSATS
jgi:predicted transcriptional regulator